MAGWLTLNHTRAVLDETRPEALAALCGELASNHGVKLVGFLGAELCALAATCLASATFSPKSYDHVGAELTMDDNVLSRALTFVLNDRALFAVIERLSGCGRIGDFKGRVYRLEPGGGQLGDWHNDAFDGRLIGLSINLSDQPFEGGVLQIRGLDGGATTELANTHLGDALLFRISDRLQHRLTPVTGAAAKTSFAGWFRTGGDYETSFRHSVRREA